MKNTKLEILTNGSYIQLDLHNDKAIRYNAVVNKIGSITTREISHTNTFVVPWTANNIKALGINEFNPYQMANSLNTKYQANYYVNDQLLQKGFIVINNTDNGRLSLNFIDEALSLTDTWGTTTYKDLLNDDLLMANVDSDITDALTPFKDYSLTKTDVVTVLNDNIVNYGYPVGLFPSTLNAIGDKFQHNSNDVRVVDYFNPFQCRPIFNAMAFIQIACQAYGYTAVLDDEVDWAQMEKFYIPASNLADDQLENAGLESTTYYGNDSSEYDTNLINTNSTTDTISERWFIDHSLMNPTVNSIAPNNVTGLDLTQLAIELGTFPFFGMVDNGNWQSMENIFIPQDSSSGFGSLIFTSKYSLKSQTPNISYLNGANMGYSIGIWNSETTGEFIFEHLYVTYFRQNEDFGYYVTNSVNVYDGTSVETKLTVDMALFSNPPVGATTLYGILRVDSFYYDVATGTQSGTDSRFENNFSQLVEEAIPEGVVSYDEFGQFAPDEVDLTYAAPSKSIKELLNGLFQKEGILINVDTDSKEVEFFNYKSYGTRVSEGNFVDWTNYLQEYIPYSYNTNYGNTYANRNDIGLGSPYLGNTYSAYVGNQVLSSKFKAITTNYNTILGDVTKAVEISGNSSGNNYIEFSIGGLSLIEDSGSVLGSMTQNRYDADSTNYTQGTITGVPIIQNVSYLSLAAGVSKWYELVDRSVRCKPYFLLPLDTVKNIDLTLPIYVGQLGGFYIIEEIEQYVDNETAVRVKLIKILDNTEPPNTNDDQILITSAGVFNDGTNNYIITNYEFINYTPISATIYYFNQDTGEEFNDNIDVNQTTHSYQFPSDGSLDGSYEVFIKDDSNNDVVSQEVIVVVP